eukprot:GHVP01035029.1.p1 GENE.GHVP01035029.1~~GHVP01035029.1.p1  ORF type:complete len:151 (-),score=0.86 GHVP01035029.1:312-764(-)
MWRVLYFLGVLCSVLEIKLIFILFVQVLVLRRISFRLHDVKTVVSQLPCRVACLSVNWSCSRSLVEVLTICSATIGKTTISRCPFKEVILFLAGYDLAKDCVALGFREIKSFTKRFSTQGSFILFLTSKCLKCSSAGFSVICVPERSFDL